MVNTNTLGSVAFFSTYRPLQPLNLFSLPASPSIFNQPPSNVNEPPSIFKHPPLIFNQHELPLADKDTYNYNGKQIPPSALKLMLKRSLLAPMGTEDDVDSGQLTGLIMVSERITGLETLYIALTLGHDPPKIFSFADVYGTYGGVRMEDSPTFAGEYIFYITTKDENPVRRQPWTVVYKTHLVTGETERVTPDSPVGIADLNPVASPNGTKLAVASFQENGWQGEIEDLKTDIVVIQLHNNNHRHVTILNGGWPTWGSENVLFFHRKVIIPDDEKKRDKTLMDYWAVFRADISNPFLVITTQVTPEQKKAFTPVAINEHTVVVGTIRKGSGQGDRRMSGDEYRHVEIFDTLKPHDEPIHVTKRHKAKADHYNPFLIVQHDGQKRIGYHRGAFRYTDLDDDPTVVKSQQIMTLQSPTRNLGLFRVSGVFPTFSKDGKKLAYVDNEFHSVWLWNPDVDTEVVPIYTPPETDPPTTVFSPVWSQDPTKDIVYFCQGPAFMDDKELIILAIVDASSPARKLKTIVKNKFNNAFPCTNPEGTRLVFRSTKDGGTGDIRHKSLYIREKADVGSEDDDTIEQPKRLTTKDGCTDTHCDWSPNGKWIVFSSSRDKPEGTEPKDFGLDPGYFAVYLLAVDNPDVVILVMQSALNFAGHVNHPFFSPKGNQIVVSSDIAGVSCDPVSLPLFTHSVRPYGDIFTIDIDPEDITKNHDLQGKRMTHSKFENSTCTWTVYSAGTSAGGIPGGIPGGIAGDIGVFFRGFEGGQWDRILNQPHQLRCPFIHADDGSEGWQMTGHLMIPNSKC